MSHSSSSLQNVEKTITEPNYMNDYQPPTPEQAKILKELQKLTLGKYSCSTSKYVGFMPFREEYCGVYCLAFSMNGSLLLIGLGNGEVQVYDKKSCQLRKVLNGSLVNNATTCVKFHPTFPDLFYAGSKSGTISLNDLEGESKFMLTDKNNEINTLDTDIHGMRLIAAGKDACIRTYNPETRTVIQIYGSTDPMKRSSIEMHNMRIYCLKFHPTNHYLFASGGLDSTVKIWDVRTNDGLVKSIEGPFIFGDAIDIKDNKILTGSNRGKNNLQLWDLGSGLLINNIIPHNRSVSLDGEQLYTAKFFCGEPAGDLIMCGGAGYRCLKLISLKENLIVQEFPEKKPITTCSCFENEISYGSTNGNCYLVKYFIDGEMEEVENVKNEEKELDDTSLSSSKNGSAVVEL